MRNIVRKNCKLINKVKIKSIFNENLKWTSHIDTIKTLITKCSDIFKELASHSGYQNSLFFYCKINTY